MPTESRTKAGRASIQSAARMQKAENPYGWGFRFLFELAGTQSSVFGGPVSEECLIEHLNRFSVAILERPPQLTAQPLWHSITPETRKSVQTPSGVPTSIICPGFSLCFHKIFTQRVHAAVHLNDFDAGKFQQFFGIGVWAIRLFVKHASNACLNQALCTVEAGQMRHV